MKTGKEQIDRLPNVAIWNGMDLAVFFLVGLVVGTLITVAVL